MKARFCTAVAGMILSLGAVCALADEPRPYTEGTVSEVTSVRTKPGMFEAYMKWLDGTFKKLMDEEKKAGIVLNYTIYSAEPRSPRDPNLYIVTEFKNLAALDGIDEKIDPIEKKYFATRDAASKAAIDRESVREILGTELVRELKLK